MYIIAPDVRPAYLLKTEAFGQHDVSVRYDLTDQVRIRAGVTNLFDAEPTRSMQGSGGDLDQFDLFGTRFFFGLNYRM